MNPQSTAITGSGNPLKSLFESEIRAKILSESTNPFTYSPPLGRLVGAEKLFCKMRYLIEEGKLMRYRRYVKKEGLWEYSIKGKQFYRLW